MMNLALGVALMCGLAVSANGAERSHVEVSEDGRQTVVVSPPGAVLSQSSPTPIGGDALFGSEPDWMSTVRMQVGGLAVADLNNDGLMDVVVGHYISNSFPPYDEWHNSIYYNTGSELESVASWASTDEVSTGDIQVADFNNDGYLDVFAANGGPAMADSVIYWGSKDGPSETPGWSSNEPGNAWNNYAIPFDYDHDGDIDVFTANQGNSEFDPYRPMYLFENIDGVLQTVPSWQSSEESIQNGLAFGDLDGDGWEDLAVSKWVNFESGVYRNNAGTMATSPIWTTGDDSDERGIAWADVDGDGDMDLALGHDPTQLFTNADGVLGVTWTSEISFFGQQDFKFADVDDDGDMDLAEVHFSNGHVNIYQNNDGVLDATPTWTYDAPSVGTAVAFGDINGDGRTDVVVGVSGEPSIRVFYAPVPACPADLTDDGVVDTVDLLALLNAWGTAGGDLSGDGTTDTADLLALLGAWGSCG